MEMVGNQSEAPAIKALGSLFKLTEVHLWDDGSKETRESFCVCESESNKSSRQRDKSYSSVFHSTSDFNTLPEDIELAKEMDALGLPLSFHTNKETRSKMTGRKNKGVHQKHSHGHKDAEEMLEFSKVSEMEIVSPSIFHDNSSSSLCCISMLGRSESDARENIDSMTKELTGTISDADDILLENVALAKDQVETLPVTATRKGKKKTRRRRQRKLSRDDEEAQFEGMFEEYSGVIGKYWCQRYMLFSRFDDGIQMDEEGWFSVTPEPIARHHASRCGSGIVVDSFTGVGGNAIQLAQWSAHVIAIDIDPKKIGYAYHNAAVYGVDDRIDFMTGDFFTLAPKLKADTVFLSPPWGGPDYTKVKIYDLKTMLRPHDGYFLFDVAKKIACRIVMFLPRNVDLNQLAELSMSAQHPWSLEVEKNFLNGKLKAVTAYFTETADRRQ